MPEPPQTPLMARPSGCLGVEVTATFIAIAAGLSLLSVGAFAGWPGAKTDCDTSLCFCEAARGPPMQQPVNTLSNLAVVTVGLVVAVMARADRRRRQAAGRSVPSLDVLGVAFSLALVIQGLGSMAFHASLTQWGGAVDAWSMFSTIGLLVMTNLLRLEALRLRQLFAAWLLVMVLGSVLGALAPDAVSAVMFLLFVTVLATEVLASRREKVHDARYFRGGLALHLASVTVWTLSLTPDSTLCVPSSFFQPHALWHVAEGGVIMLFWLHARLNIERADVG